MQLSHHRRTGYQSRTVPLAAVIGSLGIVTRSLDHDRRLSTIVNLHYGDLLCCHFHHRHDRRVTTELTSPTLTALTAGIAAGVTLKFFFPSPYEANSSRPTTQLSLPSPPPWLPSPTLTASTLSNTDWSPTAVTAKVHWISGQILVGNHRCHCRIPR